MHRHCKGSSVIKLKKLSKIIIDLLANKNIEYIV